MRVWQSLFELCCWGYWCHLIILLPRFCQRWAKTKKRRKREEKANKRKYERQRKSKISLPVKSSGYISYLYSVKKNNCIFEKTGYNETWTVINSPGNSIISEIQWQFLYLPSFIDFCNGTVTFLWVDWHQNLKKSFYWQNIFFLFYFLCLKLNS